MEGYALIRRNTKRRYGVCAINALASYPTKEPSAAPSPKPSPAAPPPPPPHRPPPPPPLPPPPPTPTYCGGGLVCPPDNTCCCLYEFFGICFIQGCCGYKNGVCCGSSSYCCPSDYPICHVYEGLCLKVQFAYFRPPKKWTEISFLLLDQNFISNFEFLISSCCFSEAWRPSRSGCKEERNGKAKSAMEPIT